MTSQISASSFSSWTQTALRTEFAVDLQNNLLAFIYCPRCRKAGWGEITTQGQKMKKLPRTTQLDCSWADSCLTADLPVLCHSFAVYAPLRLCLGDEQHPKMAANTRRAIKTRQKVLITTSPPRAQSLVKISLFRSSRTEDVPCADDMLASALLELDKNNVRCWCIPSVLWQSSRRQALNQYRHTCSVLAGVPLPKGRVSLRRIWSINQEIDNWDSFRVRSTEK